MNRKIFLLIISLCLLILQSCNGQNNSGTQNPIGGSFENRDFIYYGIPEIINSTDTSPGWKLKGEKLLLTGTVYKSDGKTVAPNVLLYYYHTNSDGIYPVDEREERNMPKNSKGQSHGFIRGWVKTDERGRYNIYTIRPGVYPTRDEPAHIHINVKEPNELNEYYIDDFVFDDDKILNSSKRQKLKNRAGSGILRLVKKQNLLIGERDIILGLNIPGYPETRNEKISSGKNIGEEVFSFIPYHAFGPDKGTNTCPVCKYGWYQGILYFVGNHPDWNEIKSWLKFLEAESEIRKEYLKVYFVYGNEKEKSSRAAGRLSELGNSLNLKNLALTIVPSFSDKTSEIYLNRINPEAGNTIIIYKRSRIIGKFVNLSPDPENFLAVTTTLDQSVNEYFSLPKTANADN